MHGPPHKLLIALVLVTTSAPWLPGCRCNRPRAVAKVQAPQATPVPAPAPAPAPAPETATTLDLSVHRPEARTGALRGLDDGGALLGLAVAWLRRELPALAGPGPLVLHRRGGGMRVERFALDGQFTSDLERPEAGLHYVGQRGSCSVQAGPVRAVCPVEEAAALRALTGLVLLAAGTDRPDADLVLETLRGGDLTRPVRLGLASLALADRWTVEMEPRTGRVLALNIQVDNRPARLAIGRGQPVRLTLQVADRAAGAWNLAKEDSSATEASLEVLLEAKVAQMADAETALRGLSAVATGLGGTITGPEALVVRWRGGRMTTLAVQAPALLPADARHEAIRRLPTAGQSALSLRVRGGRIDRAMEAASLSAGCYRVVVLGSAPTGDRDDAVAALRPCAPARGRDEAAP